MFQWLRRLLKALKNFPTYDELKERANAQQANAGAVKSARVHRKPATNTYKELNQMRIAEANKKRQRDTLGHGLKGSFKPRSAHEKSTWNISKKPEND